VVLADIDERRTTEIAGKLPAGKVEALTLDVSDRKALLRALKDVDFVINGLTPDCNLGVHSVRVKIGWVHLLMSDTRA
jgi:saccharopine dehydrogenase-like NADP-dependent oxidoreductase